jgi:hypothetical protein
MHSFRFSAKAFLYLLFRLVGGNPDVARCQGCQMVCFQTKKKNLGKFYEGLRLENVYIFYGHLEYFMEIWDIL